jgi:PAS domain S-box-containing protein
MQEQPYPIVIALDTQANILTINDTCEKVTGYTANELVGKNWVETLIPEGDRGEIRELIQNIVEGDLYIGNENPILTREGDQLMIRWTNFRLMDGNCGNFNPDGDIVGVASIGYYVSGDDGDDGTQI